MPIYEYRCSSCGHELEALQKLSEDPLRTCPACKTDSLVKQVSAAGFQLKGSGWYATDFKGGAKPASTKTDEGAKPAGEAKTPTASDSKSESKSESATPASGGGTAAAAAPATGK